MDPFCNGCNFKPYPPCTVIDIPKNVSLDDLLTNKKINYSTHLICHVNSQELLENKMVIKDTCDNCGLCKIACPYQKNTVQEIFSIKLEKLILKDIYKASIFFKSLFPNIIIAPETNVEGNFRTKRIDLAIISKNLIYIVKILPNTEKIEYYSRSYKTIVENLSEKYRGTNIYYYILIPETEKLSKFSERNECVTIKTLYNLL